MSSNISNTVPYLRTTRDFPEDPQVLRIELNKMYIDIANVVNARTIGLFTNNKPVVNGEQWFTEGLPRRQQALRQIYPFVAADLPNIPHQIIIPQISGFVRIWGTYVDAGGIWYPLPYVDATASTNQVALLVNATNIVVTVGAGAPVPVRGTIILEWLSQT